MNNLAGYGSSNLQPRSNNKLECVNIQKIEKQFIQQYWLKYSSPEDVNLRSKYLALQK